MCSECSEKKGNPGDSLVTLGLETVADKPVRHPVVFIHSPGLDLGRMAEVESGE
jgi:hypothetical protein